MGLGLLCATEDGLFMLRAEPEAELSGRAVAAVAAGRAGAWAIVDGRELWGRVGGRWKQVASADRELRCLVASEAGVFAGTAGAHLLRLVDDVFEVVDGFERAEGRGEWYTPWGGPPDVRSLSAIGTMLLANVHVGGILRSDDAGETWKPTIDIDADVHQVVATKDLLLAATARGLATSDDGGESWRYHDRGLHARYARAVAAAGSHVFLSVSEGPSGRRAAVYRGEAGGGEFEKCERGLPDWFAGNIDTGCLTAAGSGVAFGTRDGRVFVSEDAGESWAKLPWSLPAVRTLTSAQS